jgi:putative addiction module killer protein
VIAVPRLVYKLILDGDASPVDEFLESIRDKTTRARIVRQLDKIERGNFGANKEFDGIGEIRIDLGPGYRVYYGKHGNVIVILLGGGDKKSQQSDIEQAKQRWEAWKKQGADVSSLPSWSNDEAQSEEKDDSEAV